MVSNLIAVFSIAILVFTAGIAVFWIETNDFDTLYGYNKNIYQSHIAQSGVDSAFRSADRASGHSLQYHLANVVYYWDKRPADKDRFNFPDVYSGQDNFLFAYTQTTEALNSAFGADNWYLYIKENSDVNLGVFKPEEKRIAVERILFLPDYMTIPDTEEEIKFAHSVIWVYEAK